MPEIHYAPADGADIAYTVTGEGDIPLVWTLGYMSHLEVNWAFPLFRRFAEALGELTRLIVYDKRGMGLSSRVAAGEGVGGLAGSPVRRGAHRQGLGGGPSAAVDAPRVQSSGSRGVAARRP